MNRIRLLPEQVANQIAAGEVVERPASVVKELVENSLDAGATRIAVEIQAAGRSLIRVNDDGCGMNRDDALLCLERHATSKIIAATDLSRITTMGFRGEAIPSIASVSRFALTTRERAADAALPGTQILIHGGKILEVRESGGAVGTTVEVRSLFFNVPARRKFLRSDETERAHIQQGLTTMALANPQVGFTLIMEGRLLWQLPAIAAASTTAGRLHALRDRLRLLLGGDLALIPVDDAGELPSARIPASDPGSQEDVSPPEPIQLWGWIGAPGISRATRADQYVFVNRRPVENRGLNAALLEGYHNALMKGRYPLACLFLELNPAEVDVNIHPAKREVKFHREQPVRRFVALAVRHALTAFHAPAAPPLTTAIPTTQPPRSSPPIPPPSSNPTTSLSPIPTPASSLRQPEFTALHPDRPDSATPELPPPAESGLKSPRLESETPKAPSPADSPARTPDSTLPSPPPSPPVAIAPSGPVPLLAVPLRLVGVIGRLYVVFESDRGLVLLDQHAAHERILYEEVMRRFEEGQAAPSQRLLLPETLELPARDAAFLRENLATLTRLGVGLSVFGDRTFLLDAVPPFVRTSSSRRFALELVDELRAAGLAVNSGRLGEHVIAKTVCRHAVKANDPLAGPELESLVDQLRRCHMPYTCPHGRPTLIEMNFRELEKRFGRVQG